MRKLKLQVQITVDGFVAGPNGELDWMTFGMDDRLAEYVNALTDSSDTILLGRKMTDGFVNYWTSVLDNPESPEYSFAQKMVNTPKVVFSKTVKESIWANTTVANGDLVEEVEKLKQQDGKDIIVYGGATFVSNLIKANLIDEFHLCINPTALGRGLTIFGNLDDRLKLKLVKSNAFSNGEVVNHYEPEK
ncbi:MAG TPA: dihydrofolate reductase family protein [Pyrinomonadaceae bacterium]|jgi:dihydrofolate reductase|nr:dihydrofolate reductase family protein [Pyrinomonadaceae bacterium]